ncbi:carboxypeptidase regulatory-like domain-containing protein [Cryptosporangium phraense]|uniref:carboxypeptidase regulatory-like domain-containing protein n=1 Tax=Cryptosporangium phraense TaxID=2593070 RepID=UPI001479751C|nr:carboxypeptidase regulatory-like domain-containing protein [Cryptosporangium phraense]
MRYARRLGATLLAAFALLLLSALPAHAGDPADLRLEVRQGNLATQAGGQPATLVFAITNDGPSKADAFNANVVIPFGDRGVVLASSSPSCNQVGGPTVLSCPVNELDVGKTTVFTLVIAPPQAGSLPATDAPLNAAGQISIDAGGDDPNGANDSSQFTLTLTGAPPAVTQINGTVADGQSGQPISGASVTTRDVNGATCLTTTDSSGAFNCTPTPDRPLAGGQVTIEATMAGYQVSRTTVNPQNGTVTGVSLALEPVASASPSPSPAAPSSAAPSTPAPQAAVKTDDGGIPWDTVILIVGIVVALGGLGALGFWLYKRGDKDNGGPGGPSPDLPDLVAAESIMPTMPMRVPQALAENGSLAETAVAAPYGSPDATAVWGAPPPAPAPGPGADAWQQVNRSTEPIQVSGAAGGWSGGNSTDSTAEWPTVSAETPVSGSSEWGTPGRSAYGASDAPLAGWDTPPVYPASAPPAQGYQASAPPYPVSGASYPASAPPAQSYSAPPAQSFSAPPAQPYSAPPAPGYPASGPPAGYPTPAPGYATSPSNYPASAPPAPYPASAPPAPYPASAPPNYPASAPPNYPASAPPFPASAPPAQPYSAPTPNYPASAPPAPAYGPAPTAQWPAPAYPQNPAPNSWDAPPPPNYPASAPPANYPPAGYQPQPGYPPQTPTWPSPPANQPPPTGQPQQNYPPPEPDPAPEWQQPYWPPNGQR